MGFRHLSRSLAMQILYQWDFHGCDPKSLEKIADRTVDELASGIGDKEFIYWLVDKVKVNLEAIDVLIAKAAPEWPLAQIPAIDRNVLRVGLAELLYGDKKAAPAKVAIDEAIELAKRFGSETSGGFVNGVLGNIFNKINNGNQPEALLAPDASNDPGS